MTLDLKYRPTRFCDVLGQDVTKTVLRSIVMRDGDSLPTAYIFHGPHSTGKTTMARIFSRALLCRAPREGEPCDECQSCLDFLANRNFNYSERDAASRGKVDHAREMVERSSYTSLGGRRTVIVQDEAHMMTTQAQNSLLKLLEEGPESMILIFATTAVDQFLRTVRSRCLPFEFRRTPHRMVLDRLRDICSMEGLEYDAEALGVVVASKRGHLRDILKTLELLKGLDGITMENVRMVLHLDTEDQMYHVLLSLGTDLPGALEALDEILLVQSPRDALGNLSRVALDGFRSLHRASGDLLSNSALAIKVSESYGDKLSGIIQLLSNLGHAVRTREELLCVLVGIHTFIERGALPQETGLPRTSPSPNRQENDAKPTGRIPRGLKTQYDYEGVNHDIVSCSRDSGNGEGMSAREFKEALLAEVNGR